MPGKKNGVEIKRGKQLYEGKAKIIYATNHPDYRIMYFKDDATAFNALKKGTIVNKGIMNNAISGKIFEMLAKKGVPNHFVTHMNDREMLVKTVAIVPIEVVVRNYLAGSLSKRMGLPEGGKLKRTLVEFYYKRDDLGDPPVTEDHIEIFGLASRTQIAAMRTYALQVNKILVPYFKKLNVTLVDYKLEFGVHKGKLLLADEITPDGCRLWDAKTGEKLDKDRFRRDLGNIEQAYQEILRRVSGGPSQARAH